MDPPSPTQQQVLSLFLRSEREVFRCVAALVPNVADAEDIVQQTTMARWEKFDAYDPDPGTIHWVIRNNRHSVLFPIRTICRQAAGRTSI